MHMAGCLNVLKSCICCVRPPPPPPLQEEAPTLQPPATTPLSGKPEPLSQGEVTLEVLDALLEDLSTQLDRLDPKSCCPSSSQLNVLFQWKQRGEEITKFMKSLPNDPRKEVGELLMTLVKNTLGGLGGVHWMGLGCSLIAWSLDNLHKMSENHDRLLQLLRDVVNLLKRTKEIWQEAKRKGTDNVEDLQDSVLTAFRCALVCTANLEDPLILRLLKASTALDAINSLEKQLEGASSQNLDFMIKDMYARTPTTTQPTYEPDPNNNAIVGRMSLKQQALKYYLGSEGDGDIRALVLHGMGGVGKSTFGMEIFKELQALNDSPSKYECIRVEVPATAEKDESKLPEIQKEILEKLTHRESHVSNVTDGRQSLKKALRSTELPLFLYIDNVLKPRHIAELLPAEGPCFPRGSKILVTTRNSSVQNFMRGELNIANVEVIEVRKLEMDDAKKLLRRVIKGGPQGKKDMDIVGSDAWGGEGGGGGGERMVLELCDGLPLALQVVGSYIRNKLCGSGDCIEAEVIWEEVASAMWKAEPLDDSLEDDLYHRLRFSIDSLIPACQKAFLDIVAFRATFRDCGGYMSWKSAERLVGGKHLQTLYTTALVQKVRIRAWVLSTISEDDVDILQVHDVLQKMGMQMVEKDKQEIRITSDWDFRQFNIDSLNKVVGLSNVTLDVAQLERMPRLRILKDVRIEGEVKAIPLKELVVLHSECRPLTWPFNLSESHELKEFSWYFHHTATITNLEVLRNCRKLQVLRVGNCHELENVDAVEGMRFLEVISLSGCRSLKYLPERISELTRLRVLSVWPCPELQTLPEGMEHLTALEELTLLESSSLKSLPKGISGLTRLRVLDLDSSLELQTLPEGMVHLTALEKLKLYGCSRLKYLIPPPKGISALTRLKVLDVRGCSELQTLPEGMAHLTALEELRMHGSSSITNLPEGISELTRLSQLEMGFPGLQTLPEGMANLTALEMLTLSGCSSVKYLPKGISGLTRLRVLDLSDCSELQTLPEGMADLTALQDLILSRCSSVKCLPEGLTSLRTLQLIDCPEFQTLPAGMADLTALECLVLIGCSSLKAVPEGISALTRLKTLDLSRCSELQTLPEGLIHLTTLETLSLSGCLSLKSLPEGILALTRLRWLWLSDCAKLQTLPEGMAHSMTALKELGLEGCSSLKHLPEGLTRRVGLRLIGRVTGCND